MISSCIKSSLWAPEEQLVLWLCSMICIMERPQNSYANCLLSTCSWIRCSIGYYDLAAKIPRSNFISHKRSFAFVPSLSHIWNTLPESKNRLISKRRLIAISASTLVWIAVVNVLASDIKQMDKNKDCSLISSPNYLDNNNCTPSFFRSFCEIWGDCFGPSYFWDAPSENYRGPKAIADKFTQWLKTRWCKIIIVINCSLHIFNAF